MANEIPKGLRPYTDEDRAKAAETKSRTQAARLAAKEEAAKTAAMAKELGELNSAIRDAGIEAVLADDRLARHPNLLREMLGYATTMMLAPIVTGSIAPTSVKEAAAAAQAFHGMLKIEQGAARGAMTPMATSDPIAQADRKAALASFAANAKSRLAGGVTPITDAPSAQAQ